MLFYKTVVDQWWKNSTGRLELINMAVAPLFMPVATYMVNPKECLSRLKMFLTLMHLGHLNPPFPHR